MKKRVMILITISMLTLCITLAGCGKDNTNEADSSQAASSAVKAATADQAVTEAAAEAPTSAPTAAAASPTGQPSSTAASAETLGKQPSFTITMKNTGTKKTYSAACSYAPDRQGVVSGYFYLPGGKYEIEVSEYSDTGDAVSPEATGSYDNPVSTNTLKSVRVDYTPESGTIKVEVPDSEPTQ